MNALQEQVVAAFESRHGQAPDVVVRAPGRVNLIGEHTDYNDGFVMPMAIDSAIWLALRPCQGDRVRVHSLDFDETGSFDLADVRSRETGHTDAGWIEYLKGVSWALLDAGHDLEGWEGVVAGDVPVGAGLSSSAALEMACARASAAVSGLPWEPAAMAKLGQRAENEWVGVNCGIMDQMISACGGAGHALLLDCRSLAGTQVPLPESTVVVVMDTGTRRGLVDSAYNERRSQCEAAAAHFGVPALRDVSVQRFEQESEAGMPPGSWGRARHVITENERTERAAVAMREGDAAELGRLMDASHESLRADFEVSSAELDAMVDCAHGAPGCLGARMTGAGFGGCAVALVSETDAEPFSAQVAERYTRATGQDPSVFVCTASDGAALV